MTIDLGQTLDGKYRVVRHIGAGGMGVVYEGENVLIGRRVAIKLLHAQVASMPEFVERFEREARAAVRIGSPHVCDVLDLGHLPNGDRFIVMEYLEGQSLEDRLEQRTKLTPEELAPIAFELLEGLGTMHAAGVIHRDLKPANIFLARARGGRGEVVKILDFGVAKLMPKPGELGAMTQTGAMMGTPLYMSPEQARGARDVDGRSDIYSASVIFYRALAGELPYMAQNLNELLFKIVLEDPRPLRELAPEVDETFAGIVHRGLSRDLEQRFLGARAFQEAIAQWGRSQGRRSLSFDVTLPTDPPPRIGSGSSARIATSAVAVGVPGTGSEGAAGTGSPSDVAVPPQGTVVSSGGAGHGRVAAAVTPTPSSGGGGPAGASEALGARDATRALGPSAGTPLSWSGTAPPGPSRGSTPTLSSGALPVAKAASASSLPAERAPSVSTLAATQSSSEPSLPTATASAGGSHGASPDHAGVGAGAAMQAAASAPSGRATTAPTQSRARSKAIAIGAVTLVLVAGVGFAVSRGGRGPATASAATDPSGSASSLVTTPPATTTAAAASSETSADTPSTSPSALSTTEGAVATRPDAASAAPRRGATTPGQATSGAATATAATTGKGVAPLPTTTTALPTTTTTASAAPASSSHGRRFRTNLD